ncbi:MAG: sigma-54-dependent Fis family transcriptional regulator [Pirellulaceae bacterium]
MSSTDNQLPPLTPQQTSQWSKLLGELPTRLMLAADQATRLEAYFQPCCELIHRGSTGSAFAGAESVTLWRQDHQGNWSPIHHAGAPTKTGATAVAKLLAKDQATCTAEQAIVPIPCPNVIRMALLLERPRWSQTEPLETLVSLSRLLAYLWKRVHTIEQTHHRNQRLEQLLEIIHSWQQSQDTLSLLEAMAESATRFFESERASIFLWDRPRKKLIGRPALGVEGGELVIPDDRGVVGHVVQTGETRRVDDMQPQEVNREVDKQLAFHTHSLLCVPLIGRRKRILGAFELINKLEGNFTAQDEAGLVELAQHAATALENSQQIAGLIEVQSRVAAAQANEILLIGESPPVNQLRTKINRVAQTDLPVLVLGENGTGKEIVSRMIHFHGPRRNQPLVAVNCAALPDTLLESELFGHEKGAFTDARETKAGKFELASGGTLFLDEIGDMSLAGQAKLLRALEQKVVTRLGGQVEIPVDTRVVAATNQDLPQLVKEQKFREDLFYRLDVVSLNLPPLRDRGDDILLLAHKFLEDFSRTARREMPLLTPEAEKRLLRHTWPGNIRELKNLMERLAFLSDETEITPAGLPFSHSSQDEVEQLESENTLAAATDHFQRQHIQQHLNITGGNISQAAQRMGLHRSNLHRKMKQLGMLD